MLRFQKGKDVDSKNYFNITHCREKVDMLNILHRGIFDEG
jgi:hypothetical protein